jgi:hypothetical protein
VEIRKILVGGQPRQKVKGDSTSTNKLGMVEHFCNPRYTEGIGRRIMSKVSPSRKFKTLSEKQLKQKKGWGHGSSDQAPA